MPKRNDTGRKPGQAELREAMRIAELDISVQRTHPRALPADPTKLQHINTYGSLPDFYIDRPFCCRLCGQWEIWKAHSQKWYYEEAKGHIDATAVACHACRKAKSRE